MKILKDIISKHWELIIIIIMIIFNVGYTIARIEDKPSRMEVKEEIKIALEEQKKELKEMYIRIDQVPGLKEKMESLENKIDDFMKRLDKMENKLIYKIN